MHLADLKLAVSTPVDAKTSLRTWKMHGLGSSTGMQWNSMEHLAGKRAAGGQLRTRRCLELSLESLAERA
jgi:hypothetical protein